VRDSSHFLKVDEIIDGLQTMPNLKSLIINLSDKEEEERLIEALP